MKIERIYKKFVPVSITLETQKEFNYLKGLCNGANSEEKEKCEDFDDDIDSKLWELMDKL